MLATGAAPVCPNIPGIDGENVYFAIDVLKGKAEISKLVVIIGGGAVGIEAALFVAKKGAISAEAAVFLAAGGAMDAEAAVQLAQKGKDVMKPLIKSVETKPEDQNLYRHRRQRREDSNLDRSGFFRGFLSYWKCWIRSDRIWALLPSHR